MATSVLEQTRGALQDFFTKALLCSATLACRCQHLHAAGHEEAEHLERLIVKDFRNELRGHKERLYQNHRVRKMLDNMQTRARQLVSPLHHAACVLCK